MAVLRHVVRLSVLVLAVYAGLLVLAYLGFRTVPLGFIPQQDQGYLIVALQLPDASSIDRTRRSAAADVRDRPSRCRAWKAPSPSPDFNLLTGTNQTNAATMFLPLKHFSERTGKPAQSADAILAYLMGQFARIKEAVAWCCSRRPYKASGRRADSRCRSRTAPAAPRPKQLQAAAAAVMAAARKDPRIAFTFSTFHAGVPQLYANVDRVKAKKENVAVTDIFQTLQVYLGSYYVNDFNYLGRTYRVMAQADAPFRRHASDVPQLKTRNSRRRDGPAGDCHGTEGHHDADRINRYDLYPSAEINGAGARASAAGRRSRSWRPRPGSPAQRLFATNGPNWPIRKRRPATRRCSSSRCACCSCSSALGGIRELRASLSIILIVPMCLLCGIAGV